MPVLLSMFAAVLIWSFYPFAAVLGLKSMSGLELIFFTTIIGAIGAFIVSTIYFFKRNKLKTVIKNHKNLDSGILYAILGSGITIILCHGLFFLALTMSHKAGVSLIYESWPIIAVIATPFLIRKQWKEVSFKDFLISLLALVGVVIVVLSNTQIELPFMTSSNLSQQTDYTALLGYILAFVGAYACGMNVVLKGYIADYFKKRVHETGAIIISEFHSRVLALILLLVTLPFYFNEIDFSTFAIWPSLYIGFVVMILGGAFYTYALINTDRPTIHILYYFVPLIAVFILWFFGESDVNLGLFVGGGLIIAANIYLYFSGRKAAYMDTPLPPGR